MLTLSSERVAYNLKTKCLILCFNLHLPNKTNFAFWLTAILLILICCISFTSFYVEIWVISTKWAKNIWNMCDFLFTFDKKYGLQIYRIVLNIRSSYIIFGIKFFRLIHKVVKFLWSKFSNFFQISRLIFEVVLFLRLYGICCKYTSLLHNSRIL